MARYHFITSDQIFSSPAARRREKYKVAKSAKLIIFYKTEYIVIDIDIAYVGTYKLKILKTFFCNANSS